MFGIVYIICATLVITAVGMQYRQLIALLNDQIVPPAITFVVLAILIFTPFLNWITGVIALIDILLSI